MEIYFYDENNKYIGHRTLNDNEEIPSNATTEIANVKDMQEAYLSDGKWVVTTIKE